MQLPRIAVRSARQLAAMRYAGDPVQHRNDMVAVYDSATQTVFLSAQWQGSRAVAASVIMHEMVHHLQHQTGKRFSCPQEQEEQAFAIQDAWLAQWHTDLQTEFSIDPFTRLVMSLCPY